MTWIIILLLLVALALTEKRRRVARNDAIWWEKECKFWIKWSKQKNVL
jgi:hypothetical protein